MNNSNETYVGYQHFYLRNKDTITSAYKKHCRGFRKKLSELLSGSRSRKVLDLGCGVGFLVYFLKQEGFKDVLGIDKNERLISIAKSNVNAKFIVGDGISYLDTQKEQFDIIFLWNVLEHINKEKIEHLLKVSHQRLTCNGFVVIRTPNMTNVMSGGSFRDDFTHQTGFTEQSIEQIARLASFAHIEMLNQFKMQNFKGKLKAIINWVLHKVLLWLRGGAKNKVFYRNLYAVLRK